MIGYYYIERQLKLLKIKGFYLLTNILKYTKEP